MKKRCFPIAHDRLQPKADQAVKQKLSQTDNKKQSQELYEKYHDEEWGVPVHNDQHLFEMLILEGAQAGLSWETILKRRDGYRQAFYNFDVAQVANMSDHQLEALRNNPSIIRNRLKIYSTRQNAQIFLLIQKEFGSFDQYLWNFVGHAQIKNRWENLRQTPATSKESDALSKDLKKRGMKFVGSTIMYAYMQAVGLVNDHITQCWRYDH
jgi:DNA-3-methyladenine glycosylase I